MIALLSLVDSPLVYRLGYGLVHFLWQGALIAGLLAAVLPLLRHRSSQVRHLVAWIALVAMALSVPLTIWLVPSPDVRPGVPQSSMRTHASPSTETRAQAPSWTANDAQIAPMPSVHVTPELEGNPVGAESRVEDTALVDSSGTVCGRPCPHTCIRLDRWSQSCRYRREDLEATGVRFC